MSPKAFVSWSSGKDSAFALHEARRLGMVEVVGLLTTVNEVHHRVAMHGTRESLLDRQITAIGLPCLKIPLPSPCPNAVYEARMTETCARIKAQGVRHIVFGDLFLEDIRAYREARLREAGMEGVFPLWRRDTRILAREMIGNGLVAHLVCIDPRRMERRFAGRRFDTNLLVELPETVDPCGENGEFHTAVSAGPMFAAPIPVETGEVVERDGFVFADVIPVAR
ncbi:MAG: Dph6-related ATP pyrophosphatase [Alphaproteobacteria bacterium]